MDEHRPVAKSFGVSSVPFVTLLRRGAWFAWDDDAGEPVPTPATRFEGALAADAVAAWLNNRHAAGALGPRDPRPLLTQPRPRSTGAAVQLPLHVEELTAATLLEAQRDTTSDLLVEFYGTGCGTPIQPQLARLLADALHSAAAHDARSSRPSIRRHVARSIPNRVNMVLKQ